MNSDTTPCTDEDVKRLKDYLSSPGRAWWGPGLSGDTTEAFLARLEAAEAMERPLNAFITFQGEKARDIDCMAGLERAKYELAKERIVAWRKAAGK